MLHVSDVRVLPAVFEEPLQSRDRTSAKERGLGRSAHSSVVFSAHLLINRLKVDRQRSELTIIASRFNQKS